MDRNGFSILIPTWNNLPHLQLCIKSLSAHTQVPYEVIIHVNEGVDGTLEWVKENGFVFTYSVENSGICVGLNRAFEKTRFDYIVYMNDDMYALPGWDKAIMREINRLQHPRFYFSATMIEPRKTGNSAVIFGDYGSNIESFREANLLNDFSNFVHGDWRGSMWPPSVVHRSLWEQIGGYSIEFSPGLYSDPDFCMKLYQIGVREFRGIGDSRVYHFMQKSTGKGIMNDGKTTFFEKYGVSASWFTKKVLQLGKPWQGPMKEIPITPGIKDRLRKILRFFH